ncbi:NUDIX hydrolase N-terminal domain-containing protein [Fusobacterium sp.]|uniref:NUDIX hydrolase N-terminal domain-containing protein n=1 Tax=Fusobacterium sp. TaxID=68766 RepID=UPI0026319D4D|nr:NUDIX hydrolase N-terminal domain-containing protein [Fusobacterium sp.]
MENKKYNELINLIKRNINLADLGCLYAHNGYDDERYHELKEINLKILSILSDQSLEEICKFYLPIKEYPTPKIDIRGVFLMMKIEYLWLRKNLIRVNGHFLVVGLI